MITVLASELAVRLAREELTARGSLELARQQAQLNRLVIEQMQDGVLVVDRRGRVRAANPAARALLAPSGMAPRRRSRCVACQPGSRWSRRSSGRSSKATWPESGRDVVLEFEPGLSRTLRARIRFTRRREGAGRARSCASLFLEDVRSVQARTRQEKLAAMGRVSAGIAHEIRNPLAAISQANALLLEDALMPQQRQLTRMVADNVERLKRIVDDVMEVAPGAVPQACVIDAGAQVAAVCARAGRAAAGCGVRRRAAGRDCPPNRWACCSTPSTCAECSSTCSTTRGATAAASPARCWCGCAGATPTRRCSAVASDGEPIAPEVERYLFEPFFSTRSRGTGLGLYICREAVRALRRAHRLPRVRPDGERRRNEFVAMRCARPIRLRFAEQRVADRLFAPLPSTAHLRLLVVDDEPDLRTLYELTLLREGYDIDTAGSVEDALARLEERSYSLLITDMRLPDGSGLDVLRRLEEDSRREKAIVITAYGSAENAVEALKAGAYDYLTKPVDLKQFRAVVASALGAPPAAPPPSTPSAPLGKIERGAARARARSSAVPWPRPPSRRWRAWRAIRPPCSRCAR